MCFWENINLEECTELTAILCCTNYVNITWCVRSVRCFRSMLLTTASSALLARWSPSKWKILYQRMRARSLKCRTVSVSPRVLALFVHSDFPQCESHSSSSHSKYDCTKPSGPESTGNDSCAFPSSSPKFSPISPTENNSLHDFCNVWDHCIPLDCCHKHSEHLLVVWEAASLEFTHLKVTRMSYTWNGHINPATHKLFGTVYYWTW